MNSTTVKVATMTPDLVHLGYRMLQPFDGVSFGWIP